VCRNIQTLFNFDPPATNEEIQTAALQFVRKISGFNKPSQTNEKAFTHAVEQVSKASRILIDSLETQVPPKNREVVRAKALAKAAKRFAKA
jgi:hypothetical protein